MNYTKEHTNGIDTPIKHLQTYLHDRLKMLWGVTKFDVYGRVYKNKREDKVFPEYYIGGKEYKEVLFSDTRDGVLFFSSSDFTDVNGSNLEQDCDIIVAINLKSIGSNFERQDEEVRQQVLFLLENYTRRQEVKSVVTGLDNVYRDYNGVSEYFKDMQEFHHFKITLRLRYINNKCN